MSGRIDPTTGHEVARVLVMSTAHLDGLVRATMDPGTDCCTAVTEYGGYFWIPRLHADEPPDADPYKDGHEDMPQCLRACLDFARALDMDQVQFDADGPLVNLPTYD